MPTRLADLTTLRLGGPVGRLVEATTSEELAELVRSADENGEPVLLLGGGSNLVAADAGWPHLVVLVRNRGVSIESDGDDVLVTLAAGEPWDAFVDRSVDEGWSGLAAMSGIPGMAGATPVQNVGAYGSEVADCITKVTILDRVSGDVAAWSPDECRFGFRTSAFKHTDRYVVVDVTFRLRRGSESPPVRYAELARRLGISQDNTAPSKDVREVVLNLRRSKGMVLDPTDHDTWSVGSFFVNPLLASAPDAARDCPQWTVAGGVKLSAAWLIENAGFTRGYGKGNVSVSTKHTLALTNRGNATTEELLELAREIRTGVEHKFGIRLAPEAHLIGVSL